MAKKKALRSIRDSDRDHGGGGKKEANATNDG